MVFFPPIKIAAEKKQEFSLFESYQKRFLPPDTLSQRVNVLLEDLLKFNPKVPTLSPVKCLKISLLSKRIEDICSEALDSKDRQILISLRKISAFLKKFSRTHQMIWERLPPREREFLSGLTPYFDQPRIAYPKDLSFSISLMAPPSGQAAFQDRIIFCFQNQLYKNGVYQYDLKYADGYFLRRVQYMPDNPVLFFLENVFVEGFVKALYQEMDVMFDTSLIIDKRNNCNSSYQRDQYKYQLTIIYDYFRKTIHEQMGLAAWIPSEIASAGEWQVYKKRDFEKLETLDLHRDAEWVAKAIAPYFLLERNFDLNIMGDTEIYSFRELFEFSNQTAYINSYVLWPHFSKFVKHKHKNFLAILSREYPSLADALQNELDSFKKTRLYERLHQLIQKSERSFADLLSHYDHWIFVLTLLKNASLLPKPIDSDDVYQAVKEVMLAIPTKLKSAKNFSGEKTFEDNENVKKALLDILINFFIQRMPNTSSFEKTMAHFQSTMDPLLKYCTTRLDEEGLDPDSQLHTLSKMFPLGAYFDEIFTNSFFIERINHFEEATLHDEILLLKTSFHLFDKEYSEVNQKLHKVFLSACLQKFSID